MQREADASDWWRYAVGDLRGAEVLADDASVPPRLATGLAQQCAEKALKTALVFAKVHFPKTHDLDVLREMLPEGWAARADFPTLAWLSDWLIDGRYPENVSDATESDARQAIEQATAVLRSIERDLRERGAAFLSL